MSLKCKSAKPVRGGKAIKAPAGRRANILYPSKSVERYFQLFAKTTLIDMEYNCIEVYHKEANEEWHVVHSTWSFIKPMEKNFNKAEQIV